jgi:hypothetical protein
MKVSNVVEQSHGGNGLGLGKIKGELGLGHKGNGGDHVDSRIAEGLDAMLGNKASVTTRVVAS